MNSSSIFSSRVSRSSSRNRARSLTVSGGSSPACSRRYMPTQFPRVPSLIPSSFATRAIGREVSITIFTASSLNSGEKLFFGRGNYFTFPDVHPIGWTVRKLRGTSLYVAVRRIGGVDGAAHVHAGAADSRRPRLRRLHAGRRGSPRHNTCHYRRKRPPGCG